MATDEDMMINALALDEDPEKLYDMDKRYLGHALIVNNVAKQEGYEGSVEDVKALKETYEEIGFTVYDTKKTESCNKEEMNKLLSEMEIEENHKNSNCFMLTIITHGDKYGRLEDANRAKAWQIENLIKRLNLVKNLLDKPKLLVIYACRGVNTTEGQTPRAMGPEDDELVKVPDKADFYIAYGTVPGYISIGPGDQGSFYLRLLAKNLLKLYKHHSVDRIFTCVRRELAQIKQVVDIYIPKKKEWVKKYNQLQCPEERTSLRRLLMLKKRTGINPKDLTWISGPMVERPETETQAHTEAKKQKMGGQSEAAAEAHKSPPQPEQKTKSSGAAAYPLDDPDTGNQFEVQRPTVKTRLQAQSQPPQSEENRQLEDEHISELAKVITDKTSFRNLAVALKQKNVGAKLTDNPGQITEAAREMLETWRRGLDDTEDPWQIMAAALRKAGLTMYIGSILKQFY